MAKAGFTKSVVHPKRVRRRSGLGLQPIIQHGNAEQKQRLLRPFVAYEDGGLLASYAFTDVAGGADFDSPIQRAGSRRWPAATAMNG